MFEFIGFMLGIQYGEKVFNLLGVLFRGANFIFFRMAECMGFAYTVPVHKPHVQNNSNRINGIIRGKFVLLCLPGRSKKRTLFQDISGGMVSYHAGSYVFSGEGDKWDILFYSRA